MTNQNSQEAALFDLEQQSSTKFKYYGWNTIK